MMVPMRAARLVALAVVPLLVAAAMDIGAASAVTPPPDVTTTTTDVPPDGSTTTEPPTTEPPTTEPATSTSTSTTLPPTTTTLPHNATGLRMMADSTPKAGWFHVSGVTMPTGTYFIRYQNVARALQTGLDYRSAGALDFWFRAPGAPNSKVTVRFQALDRYRRVLRDFGTLTLTTGNAMLPLPANSGTGKRVVVHSDQQQIWLVDARGRVVDTFLMSGRRIRTSSGFDQPGTFRVYSRSSLMFYCADGKCGTAKYMVRYQRTISSVGSHAIPIEYGAAVQGVQDLGWPISHGCSRVEAAKALEIFNFAPVGTLVVVK